MKKYCLPTLLLALVIGGAGAQTFENTVFQIGEGVSVSARAGGMGGAYQAVAEDYSATYYNPAGLAQIRRMEFFGTLSHAMGKDQASAFGYQMTSEASFTRLGCIGLVIPVPTYRGSLVFAGGYNRVRSFDGQFDFAWTLALPDGQVHQSWNELEGGGLNNWVLSGAVDMSPNLSLGASLNFWTGRDDYQLSFQEKDHLDLYTFNVFEKDDNIDTRFTGTNFRLGALYRVGRVLRFAATMSTPLTLTGREDWGYADTETFDDGRRNVSQRSGTFEYRVSSPFGFGFGGAASVAWLTVAGDVFYQDWSQVRFKSDPPVQGWSKGEANLAIQRTYRATTQVHLGGELSIPGLGTQLRAGYAVIPSPFKGAPSTHDREYVTFGVGFLLDKQLKFDLAWVRGTWEQTTGALSEDLTRVDEQVTKNTVFASIAVRF
ncbi:MAG: outer membrane protein transport protein [candidate division KSB1 bacterium]|nr:outer membrane protein transport protein [candidate division KSB1 bacterium]